jgi:hypothetical protein
MYDMGIKGRACGYNHTPPIGELNANAKLTVADVIEIRRIYSIGFATQKQLARRYGVGQTHIGRIVRGESWVHPPDGYYDRNND